MLADLRSAWALLVAVRGRRAVALDFAAATFGTVVLWLLACVFTLLEALP